jgi:nucleotide-binding universal stress UspA family protein
VGEAQLRNLPIRLAHAVDLGSFGLGFNLGASESYFHHLDTAGQRFLEQAREHARTLEPKVEVSASKVAGRPLSALVELSKKAFLTVVGSSGLGAISGLLAGSVSVSLTARGHSPIVVVRTPGTSISGPIVLGVSGSPTCEDATSWAFEEASMRGAELIAVHVWNVIPPSNFYTYPAWSEIAGVPGAQEEELLLAESLAGWQEKFPDVKVHRTLTTGNPAYELLRHGQHAQLIVAGSHGRGDATGLFLGSTSHALIHHAACPVLITRPHVRETAR